ACRSPRSVFPCRRSSPRRRCHCRSYRTTSTICEEVGATPMADGSPLAYVQSRLDLFLSDLAVLSGMDCGTYDKAGVDAVGRVLRDKLERIGLAVEVHD